MIFIQSRLNLKSAKQSESEGKADHINLEHVTVGRGVVVQVETVPAEMFDRVNLFYCCVGCGKVFWEGKHFKQVCSQFSHVIKENKDVASSFYRESKASYASQE